MIGSFRAVLFYPDNLSLVKDGPEERRAFLNIACANIYPSYVKIYADYKKALENRNCLLKFANKGYFFDERELASWSESMAEYASHIYIARAEYTEMLERFARESLLEISDGKEELSLSYKSDIEKRETDRLAVREEYRRRGVAGAIIRTLEESAAGSGRNKLILETAVDTTGSHQLYLSLGYQLRGYYGSPAGADHCMCFHKEIG
jgi:recombinational DNA repair ATPase RecF